MVETINQSAIGAADISPGVATGHESAGHSSRRLPKLPLSSLSTRLLALVLIAVIPLVSLIVYVSFEERSDATARARTDALSLTEASVAQQENLLEGSRQLLVMLTSLSAGANLETIQQNSCGPLFANVLSNLTFYKNFGIATKDGRIVCSALPLEGNPSLADEAYFKEASQTGTFVVGGRQADPVAGVDTLNLGYPIFDSGGTFKGITFLSIDLAWLNQTLAQTKLPEGAVITIVDQQGIVVARYPDPGGLAGHTSPDSSLTQAVLTRPDGVLDVTGADGSDQLVAYTAINAPVTTGLHAWVSIPKGSFLASVDARLTRNLILAGIFVLGVLALAWIGSELLVLRQTRKLVATTRSLAQGDFSARAGLVSGSGEIAQLAHAFDEMATSVERHVAQRTAELDGANGELKQKASELERNNAELDDFKRFFALSLDILCIADMDGYFKLVNPAWESTFGFTMEELTSRPFVEFIHPDDIEPTNAAYATQVTEGKDVVEFENRYVCKDGSYRWLLWNARTLSDRRLIYATARDVTATKLAEETLEQKARELERNNAELDDFTHVVSHDLKEPLRGIEAFSGFLMEDYADNLDETGRRYINVLQQSAVRLRDLIDDLLELSRIGRTAPHRTPVPMDPIMQDLRKSLDYTISAGGVELRVQENLPTVIGDRVRLLQVFENLVSNAVKYNDKPQGGIIEITCEERDDEFVFCVRDNGPGIAPQYHEKVFRIFQRLVRRDEQEGTGVGLALCKKIVEARGGRIWVESEGDGQGSAFFFTIPVALPEYEGQEVVNARH